MNSYISCRQISLYLRARGHCIAALLVRDFLLLFILRVTLSGSLENGFISGGHLFSRTLNQPIGDLPTSHEFRTLPQTAHGQSIAIPLGYGFWNIPFDLDGVLSVEYVVGMKAYI